MTTSKLDKKNERDMKTWLTLGNDSEVIDIFEEIYINACSKV